MSTFRFAPQAQRDLRRITERIERESGPERAARFRAAVLRAAANLALHPNSGRERPDLTARAVRFTSVFKHLIVYAPESVPLVVLHVVHGARDPGDLRDRIGEPLSVYSKSGWDGESEVGFQLNAKEIDCVRAMLHSGRAASDRNDLRQVRESEVWREETRELIETRYQLALQGQFTDGEAAFERVRQRMEARRSR